jgi:hypothetical protein
MHARNRVVSPVSNFSQLRHIRSSCLPCSRRLHLAVESFGSERWKVGQQSSEQLCSILFDLPSHCFIPEIFLGPSSS